jgi:poly(A) polymerase/tRNA nucleotidyltransferase (CCA-adding enzyme)
MTPPSARLARDALPSPAAAVLGVLAGRLAGPAWLVGGSVRDALLGRAGGDLDVAVPSGALRLGRALAGAVPGAAFVALDEARGVCRVMVPRGDGGDAGAPGALQVDIGDFEGPDLEADLRRRDFTVNALAVPLAELCAAGAGPVIDPTGGLADLAARLLRPGGPGAMAADPVRALRGVRLALHLGFALSAEAETQIAAASPALAGVAAERVRDELTGILGARASGAGLRALDRLGAMDPLLPEHRAMRATPQPEPHRFDVWEHSLRAVEAADAILADTAPLAEPALEDHLAEGLGDGMSRRHVVKLAALLHDVAKPETRTVADGRVRFIGHDVLGAERAVQVAARLRLSARATRVLERLVAQHLRPMHLSQVGVLTRRARHRFFRDLADEARDLVLLALADAAAVRGDRPLDVWRGPAGDLLRTLMAGAGEEERAAAAAPLLRGEDVMAAFGLSPGPEVGRLLAIAREAQALGVTRTPREALDHLRRARAGLLDTSEPCP